MQLMGIFYNRGAKSKTMVVLLLMETEEKISCLRSDKLTSTEIEIIKKFTSKIDTMNIGDRITWLKENIPSYNRAYRELLKEHAVIADSYNI